MRKLRRIAVAAVIAAASLVPMTATPAHAVCYYTLEGVQECGGCADGLNKVTRKVGIEIYCLM